MLSLYRDTLLKLSKTKSPQKLFLSDCYLYLSCGIQYTSGQLIFVKKLTANRSGKPQKVFFLLVFFKLDSPLRGGGGDEGLPTKFFFFFFL